MRGLKNVTADTALGGTSQKHFNVGDLVEWKGPLVPIDPKYSGKERRVYRPGVRFRGVILEFYTETKTGREVQMARILPMASQLIVEVPCVILKKVETT